jgi:hypothetical protein
VSTVTTDAQALLDRFGQGIAAFLDRAGKANHTSNIFDLRRRTLIGCYGYFDHLPWALGELDEITTPAALGAGGRGVCGAPNGPQIHGLLWGYLLGRENELGLGRPGGDPADLATVLRWWEGMTRAYRGDSALVPLEAGHAQPAASDEWIGDVLDTQGRAIAALPQLSRLTAGLQLYNFILNGEQRGTAYFHGPYRTPNGGTVVVQEFTRLRDSELPWRPDPPALAFDSVAALIEVEGVSFEFDLFAGMATQPTDYHGHIRRAAVVTCDDGEPRALTDAETAELIQTSLAAQAPLFREMVAWKPEYKVAYGAYHYLDFLVIFLRAAGASDAVVAEARERFQQTLAARLTEVVEAEQLPVWDRFFSRPQPLFSPLGATPEEVRRR